MSPPKRNLVLCAENTDAAGVACKWLVDQVYKENDVIHFVYVVKCMKPPMTIPHGMPGTAYQFDQPGPHNELKHIETAKQLLRIRFLPFLEPKHIKYELHLFAENVNAPASRVGELILGKAQQLCPALPDDADRYEGDVGSVASFLLENCKLPLALVQPAEYSVDDDNAASVATSED